MKSILKYAVLAPSAGNTQPWRFHLEDSTVELYADRSRALPVADPQGRELFMACGAALFNLLVALHHEGWGTWVELMPGPDLVARVTLHSPTNAPAEEHRLFHCIPRRHTFSGPFLDVPVSELVVEELTRAAAEEEARLVVVADRTRLVELIGEADRRLENDPQFRRESARWMRTNFTHRRTGVPGYCRGVGDLFSLFAPALERNFDLGEGHAEEDRELAICAPLLCVLETAADRPSDWVRAGRAMQHVLLAGVSLGLQASTLNQPLRLPDLRRNLKEDLGLAGEPQVVLRMGQPPPEEHRPATPRLRVADVLE